MPATISSCLNSCGLCGSAYQLPGWSRAGTRKSRAPSGVDRVSVGVSISTKSWRVEHVAGRLVDLAAQPERRGGAGATQVEVAVLEARLLADLDVLVDRERQRGGGAEHLDLGGDDLDLAGGEVGVLVALGPRATTSPVTLRQNSLRRLWATASSRTTTCTTPLASRRSRNATPPWSRRRATHPARVTVSPTWAALRVPASWVRITAAPSVDGDAGGGGLRPAGSRCRDRRRLVAAADVLDLVPAPGRC